MILSLNIKLEMTLQMKVNNITKLFTVQFNLVQFNLRALNSEKYLLM